MKYAGTGDTQILQDDLCRIRTTDNQNYEVAMAKWMIRSDGTPVSIEDVYFTYDTIIRQNTWNIKKLESYKSIKIEKNGAKLKVSFPSASTDNKVFFTNYILPKHVLEGASLQDFINKFSMEPIYTNCANIVSQMTDQYSLIFNLINCKDTSLNFYQIKNIQSFEEFETSIKDGKGSIVDVYTNQKTLPGYVEKQLLTNKLVTMFFNVNSSKLRIRTRRALAWFIRSNFYTWGYESYLTKYNDPLFNQFVTGGANVESFLKRWHGTDSIVKEDLTDIGVKKLTSTVTFDNQEPKFVFYIEDLTGTSDIEIVLPQEYSKAYVEYKGKNYYETAVNGIIKKINYSIGSKLNNFGTWLNKYKIYWIDKAGKNDFIGSIDVYDVQNTADVWEDVPIEKINIIYYQDPINEFVVYNLQNIFSWTNLIKYFDFQWVSSAEELEGKITMGEYDIVINTIDMGVKRDLTNLFITDNAKANPSQYQNQNIASYLKQYINSTSESTKSRLATQINTTYATDMPLMFLWKVFIPINFKINLREKVFWSGQQEIQLYEYDRRNLIYNKIHLVNNINIDQDKIRNYNNFSNFISQTFYQTAPIENYEQTIDETGTELIDDANAGAEQGD